ncbi:unnamed protein product [Strongylus vulgaris]|uniref:Uncharacterized protein n=1 Tax=Strongylus vulgaris TaxID=40348 RepID=A0A3P7LRW6_STRVU|nr:unnamed protein product [Strongylus vulgaris]
MNTLLTRFQETACMRNIGRFVWMISLCIVVVAAVVVAVRDLHLPEYNPLQVFIASNPHEWYDNNAEKTFFFVEEKIAIPLYVRLVWGVKTANSTAMFRHDTVTPLESNPAFSLSTPNDVRNLANELSTYRAFPFINHSEPFWPEKFLNWSAKYHCETGLICCNMSHPIFNDVYLDYCLRNSTAFITTSYNDTPLFDNNSFALCGSDANSSYIFPPFPSFGTFLQLTFSSNTKKWLVVYRMASHLNVVSLVIV